MKNRNRYKEIHQTIPEGCNRESQPYKSKAAEMPDKGIRKWLNKIGSILNLIQDLPLPNQIKEKTLFITTRKREMLKQVQHGHCVITTNVFTSFITTRKRETSDQVRGGLLFMPARKAFTLIELLVVVLIIGVLAAIAIPQYQKAVFKSSVTEAILVLKTMRDACNVLALNRGSKDCWEMGERDISDLDIEIPGTVADWMMGESRETKFFKYALNSPGGTPVAYYRGNNSISSDISDDFSLCIALDEEEPHDIICGYVTEEAEKLCKVSGLRVVDMWNGGACF